MAEKLGKEVRCRCAQIAAAMGKSVEDVEEMVKEVLRHYEGQNAIEAAERFRRNGRGWPCGAQGKEGGRNDRCNGPG